MSNCSKKISIYFNQEQYEYIKRRAEKENLRSGIFVKKILVGSLKNDPTTPDEENPFKKKIQEAD